MGESHVPLEWLERFLRLESSEEEVRNVVRHLATGCPECTDLAYRIAVEVGLSKSEERGRDAWELAYEEVFARALAFANEDERRRALEKLRGWGQWASLEPLPPQERLVVVATDPRYNTLGLYNRLLEAARQTSRSEPAEAADIVRLALVVADHLDSAVVGGKEHLADLKAAGWAALGNALRMADDFEGARQAFNEAWPLLKEGSGDPLEEMHLISLETSYLKDVGDFELAEAALAEALQLARRAGDAHKQGRILFQMGEVTGHIDPKRGIAHVRKALALIDGEREPRLELYALHDLAIFLCESHQPEEALAILEHTRPLYQQFQDEVTQLWLHWLEAKIAHRLGEHAEAESIFAQVWEEYRARGLYQEVVLITIELAQVLVEKGERERAARLAAESFTIMRNWGLHKDALSAWLVFQEALVQGPAPDDLFDRIGKYYRRHWVKPGEFGVGD